MLDSGRINHILGSSRIAPKITKKLHVDIPQKRRYYENRNPKS